MKKLLLIILIVLVVVIAGVIIFIPTGRKHIFRTGQAVVEIATIPAGAKRPPEELLPEHTALFLRGHGISEAWDRFTGSEFFQSLKETKIWKDARTEDKIALFQKEFSEGNGFEINRSKIMNLVGEDVALALLPAREAVPDAVLLLSRVGLKARVVEIMARWADGLQDEGDRLLSEEKYQGKKIFLFKPTDSFPFFGAYTFIGNYLAISISPLPVRSVIEEVIDRSRSEDITGSLKNYPDFAGNEEEAFFPAEPFLNWYLQPGLSLQVLEGDFAPFRKLSVMGWGKEILKSFSGIENAAGRVGYTDGVRSRLALVLRENRIDESGASSGDFLEYIPATALTFASSEFGLVYFWERISDVFTDLARQGYGSPLVGLRKWERESGVNISEDILPILGDNWALLIEDITGDEFIPIPPLAIIIPVSDRGEAGRIMGRIAAWAARTYNWTLTRERHGGSEIILAAGVSGGDIDFSSVMLLLSNPAYTLVGDKLIISSSSELIEEIIDTRGGKSPGLKDDPDFQEVAGVVGVDRGNFIYMNTSETMESLINIGEWYLPIQKLSHENPWLPEEVFKEKIVPILELSSIFQSAGITINIKKSVVKGEGFLYIK